MELFSGEQKSPPLNEMSPLALAFLGDGVYDLLVRRALLAGGNCPVKKLHAQAVALVNCEAQNRALKETLWPLLTEEEREIARRGRNAHTGHLPKNAGPEEYHGATALECLFGWLFLRGEEARIEELFAAVWRSARQEGAQE